MAKKKKFYVVWVGQNPGIYDSWDKCQVQIKGFPNAKYKSFKTLKEAQEAFNDSATSYITTKGVSAIKPKADLSKFKDQINFNSICVDAACSGNPGLMEYRGVETESREQLFISQTYKGGTNNLGEFLAIVHGLAYLKQKGLNELPIYTDSRTALAWIRNKKVKTTLKENARNKMVFLHVNRALNWIKSNEYKNPLLKWDTKNWGEIPADFGRK